MYMDIYLSNPIYCCLFDGLIFADIQLYVVYNEIFRAKLDVPGHIKNIFHVQTSCSCFALSLSFVYHYSQSGWPAWFACVEHD